MRKDEIDIENIIGVLLLDGWHNVVKGRFETYYQNFLEEEKEWVAEWIEDALTDEWFSCPITSIQALKMNDVVK